MIFMTREILGSRERQGARLTRVRRTLLTTIERLVKIFLSRSWRTTIIRSMLTSKESPPVTTAKRALRGRTIETIIGAELGGAR
jgi:hypothetical protein